MLMPTVKVTPSVVRGLLIAATVAAKGVATPGVTSWYFTCPDCEDDDYGEWPITIVLGTPYHHEC
jgi:hypothetical protein